MAYFEKYKTPEYIHSELNKFTNPEITDLLMGNSDPIIQPFRSGLLTGFGMHIDTPVIVGLSEPPNDDSLDKILGLMRGMHELGYRTVNDLMQGISEEGYSQDEVISVSKRIMQDILNYFRIGANPEDVNLNQILGPTQAIWENPDT